MRRFGKTALLVLLAGLGLAPEVRAQTDANVVVAAPMTTNASPLDFGFAGFTTELLGAGVEYVGTNTPEARGSPGS
jgi:hypothetical protein